MRQSLAVGMANELVRIGVAGEVAFARGIAPGALGIPVPSLHEKLSVLAVADGTPARGQNFFDGFGLEKRVGSVAGHAINGRAECVRRTEGIHHVTRSRVDADGLRDALRSRAQHTNQEKRGRKPGRMANFCSADDNRGSVRCRSFMLCSVTRSKSSRRARARRTKSLPDAIESQQQGREHHGWPDVKAVREPLSE
jgi:hypothetical protein